MTWTGIANLLGPNVELRQSGEYLQWRVAATSAAWVNLVALADIQGLAGVNGVENVTAIASYISDVIPNAAQSAGLAKFSQARNLEDYPGVDSTGTTECAAAIQAAIDAASAAGVPIVSKSAQYAIGAGITIRDHADLSRAVFAYTGTGAAITVGNPPASIVRKTIYTPYVIALTKTAPGWGEVAGSVGVDVVNTSDCVVHVGTIRNFETGLRLRGQGVGGGCTYSEFYLGTLLNNKRNLVITTDGGSGYANQNQTFGGSFNFEGTEGTAVPGTRHILLDFVPQAPDGWTFHEPSLEDSGAVCEAHIESFGHNNIFDAPRFEVYGGVPTVRWGAGSRDNEIRGGVNVDAIVEVVAPGATNRIVRLPGRKILTAGKTFDNTDEGKLIVSNAGAPATYSLPDVSDRSPGTRITVKNVAASTVTVNTTVDNLDGGFTVALAQWESRTFESQHLPDHRWITV